MSGKHIAILAGAILMMTTAASAAPIQWSDNGHWYDVVWVDAGLSWEEARDHANLSGGHLVTLTSAAENNFIWEFLNEPNNGVGGTQHYLHYWDTLAGEWDGMDNRRHMGGYVLEYADGDPIANSEPSTMMLLGAGMIGLAGLRRRLTKVE